VRRDGPNREGRAIDGSLVDVAARSVCIHGDTPGAVEIARRVRTALLDAGVVLGPFALEV
jgi:UPF0271 protein